MEFLVLLKDVIVFVIFSEKVLNLNIIELLCIFVKSLYFIFNFRKIMKMNFKFFWFLMYILYIKLLIMLFIGDYEFKDGKVLIIF